MFINTEQCLLPDFLEGARWGCSEWSVHLLPLAPILELAGGDVRGSFTTHQRPPPLGHPNPHSP